MSRLSNLSNENREEAGVGIPGAVKKAKRLWKEEEAYDTGTSTKRPERSLRHTAKKKRKSKKKALNKLLLVLAVIALFAAFLYLPQYILPSETADEGAVTPNKDAVSAVSAALKQNPDQDFDEDGINNSEELTKGTNPYSDDTDRDGISDYAELYLSKTDPTVYEETLKDMAVKKDAEKNRTLSTPFRIGNVILWADDYQSKAYGSVVETEDGYNFHHFFGYAQFPKYPGYYAYLSSENGHTPLPYRSAESVWEVDGEVVKLYKDKLEPSVCMDFFGLTSYLPSNFATELVADILPDRGFLTAYPCSRIDAEPDLSDVVSVDITKPDYSTADPVRFTRNANTLKDLRQVRGMLDEGSTVAVTLVDQSRGEYIGLVYGYAEDVLYIADPDTLEHIGVLKLMVRASQFLDRSEQIVSKEYFDFSGLGFSSEAGNLINFFAQSGSEASNGNLQPSSGLFGGAEAETAPAAPEEPASSVSAPEEPATSAAPEVNEQDIVFRPDKEQENGKY